MSKKKEATVKKATKKKVANYPPVYLTINASNNAALVNEVIETAIEEANEYGSVLYVTVNSGQPLPPPCPPGKNCHG